MDWHSTYTAYWAERWDYAMAHTDNFCAEIRNKNDVDRHEEQNILSFHHGMGQSLERVDATLERISSRGYLQPGYTALDIGAGTGAFTIPLAHRLSWVTSLDISEKMQQFTRDRTADEGLKNINFVLENWRTLDLDGMNMREAFDLVICSINPRGVCNFDTLMKMNRASRGGCCLTVLAGRGRSNGHGAALQKLILGRELGSEGGNDVIFPFNLIYFLGGQPDLNYTKLAWEKRVPPDSAVEMICFNYWRFADITDRIRGQIRDYVFSHLDGEGLFVESFEQPLGIMVWDAWRINKEN